MRARGVVLAAAVAVSAACARHSEPARAPAPRVVGADELRAVIESSKGRAVLVNVWATWCGPCRDEFPALLWLRHTHGPRGLDVVLVSADGPEKADLARKFLELHGVDFETYVHAGGEGFARSFHTAWSGAVPATFVFDGDGELRHFVEGKATYTQLAARVDEVLRARVVDGSSAR